ALESLEFFAEDTADRMQFAAIRRMSLAAGNHTVRIMLKTNDGSRTVYATYPTIFALPLENIEEYSDSSNVVETCTAANVPYMDNTASTFTDRTSTSITAYVDPNGNPANTEIELEYAFGDPNGPTGPWIPLGSLTTGYSWTVDNSGQGLHSNTSYWFRARAFNWRGCFTDYCNVTVWTTLPGAPVLSCTDCTSDSLTWAWTSNGGDGFELFDNDTDCTVITDIPGTATYTVETGLDPNTTYSRYLKAYLQNDQLTYYYNENLPEQSDTSEAWWDVCTLTMTSPPAGDYLIIATVQAASSSAVNRRSQFRFIDVTNGRQLANASYWTSAKYQSFMASEVYNVSASLTYKFQARSGTSGSNTYARNAAIIAIKLPTSNCHYVNSLTQQSITSSTWKNHSEVTVTPVASGDDYWIIHSSNFRYDDDWIGAHSRLFADDGSGTDLTYSVNQAPYSSWLDHKFINAGFSMLKGITSSVKLVDQFRSQSGSHTVYENCVHIAAVRLNDRIWQGYADNALYAEYSTQSESGEIALEKTFTVSRGQDYLVMASCSLRYGDDTWTDWPIAWWEHEYSGATSSYDRMARDETQFSSDLVTFAGTRRLSLDGGEHKLRIMFATSNASITAYARCPAIIAVPLGGAVDYSDPSNVVEISTAAAIPFMDNSGLTFTFANDSVIRAVVGANGNPDGTTIELEYAYGDQNGPTGSWIPAGPLTTGYTWDADNSGQGLIPNSSYWFRARAQNWRSCWTDYCNVTVWSTLPGGPTDFACIDCSSTTLKWMWTNNGGSGFTIFDNETDLPVVSDIAASATSTVETGLDPNTTYSRYIKAFMSTPLTYYYAESLSEQSVTSGNYENMCVLTMIKPPSGDYLVVSSMLFTTKTVGMLSSEAASRLQFHDSSSWNTINNGAWETNGWSGTFDSFMSTHLFTADGVSNYYYTLQLKDLYDTAYAQNTAIIAIKLPSANYDYVRNTTDASTTSTSPVVHTTLTVSETVASDYLLAHSGNTRQSLTGHHSRMTLTAGTNPVTLSQHDTPYNFAFGVMPNLLGGFWPATGISGNFDVTHEFWTNTDICYKWNVNIEAVRMDDATWNGYACNSYTGVTSTTSETGTSLISLTFTPAKTQNYLVLVSCLLGDSCSSDLIYSEAFWEIDGAEYDRAISNKGVTPTNGRYWATIASMRKVNLDTSSHTIDLKYRTSTTFAAYIGNASIFAIPLEGLSTSYTGPSNVVEISTAAAIPFMDNTTVTFPSCTNDSITVQVGPNGNPAGTSIELWYAIGDENGNTAAFAKWNGTLTTGYSWDVTGLDDDTSYWFMARAENWRGCFTDFCNVTVWSTLPGPPDFWCEDCSSTTLTWGWDFAGTDNGFEIYDNEPRLVVIPDIPV
ncbi:MAG: hypothetical protein ACYS8W_21390, partial [Planctomycetota bacterium]